MALAAAGAVISLSDALARIPAPSGPVKPHQASGAAAAAAGFLLWLLSRFVFHGGDVPAPVTVLIYVVVPAVFAAVSGWLAHRRLQAGPAGP